MSKRSDLIYVAPTEAPPARKPPLRETGVIRWLRLNFFNSPADALITLVTLGVTVTLVGGFLRWALGQAQWEVVFLNLRQLAVGNQFPIEALWRAETAALGIVFLSLLSVGVWGQLTRAVLASVAGIAAAMVIVPALAALVPVPTVYLYADATYALRQVNFVAQVGQTLTFTIDPLTRAEDFALDSISGYVENDNQQSSTAFDAFNSAAGEVLFQGTRDPALYDLSLAVQVWDASGAVIAQSDFSGGHTDSLVFTWSAPATGWYTFTLAREGGTAGSAWLKVDGADVFRSTVAATREREAQYGTPPALNCPGCGTALNRTDMRFVGERTVAQWFSLQLTPFLLELRSLFFTCLLVGAAGYVLGKLALWLRLPPQQRTLTRWMNVLGVLMLVAFGGWLLAGFSGSFALRGGALVVLSVCTGGYALLGLFQPKYAARAVTLLWVLSIPLVLTVLYGDAASPLLPPIESQDMGGLLLTMLLSAIAITASLPLGVLLALGRQSDLPVVRVLCTLTIEVIRGVPLITLLFMGWLILPFFGLGLGDVDLVVRITVVMTLFTAAYMAEIVRGGLQIVPKGQLEAAHALGLSGFWTTTLVVLPQALRAVIPAMMGQAVSLFKDTSLVFVVGLFEILGTMTLILSDSQTGFLAFPREGYLFVGAVYFIFSYLMAEVSRRIERTGSGSIRRETI